MNKKVYSFNEDLSEHLTNEVTEECGRERDKLGGFEEGQETTREELDLPI